MPSGNSQAAPDPGPPHDFGGLSALYVNTSLKLDPS